MSTNKMDAEMAAYLKAIEPHLSDAAAYNNLGNVYRDLGRQDEAIAAYLKAIELDPRILQAYINLLFSLDFSDSED